MKVFSTLSALFKKDETTPPQEQHKTPDHVALHNDASIKKILESAVWQAGYECHTTDEAIILPSGIKLHVELIEVVNVGPDKVRTCTKITAIHDTYFPNGLPEFQHAASNTTEHALLEGFSDWAKIDLIVLEDSVKPKPQHCTVMKMQLPSSAGAGVQVRQIILGPVMHLVTLPSQKEEDHSFCPCCLLTRNFEAFRPLIACEDNMGIRFFVCRDKDGNPTADCRVNGEAFPEGVAQLIAYASTWPERGFELRKQYIIIRSEEKEANTPPETALL